MALLMGIDLGTSSLKTIIVDEQGNVKAQSARAYQFASPVGGYAEHDPREWWQACVETVRDTLASCGAPAEEVKGVSFSGQMHGAVLLDEQYQVIRPAILHCDARSAAQVEQIKDALGPDKTRELIMNPVFTGFLLPSLMWVRDNEPENYAKVRYVCLPKDYLKFRLTGEVSSDYSDASATLAFDIRNNCWSREILQAVNIPIDFFPRCYGTADATETVCRAAAEETGLSTKTIIVAGGGDQVMQGIGNGITGEGQCSSNIGTAGQVSFQSDTPVLNPALSTNTFCGYKKGRWITMGAIMSAGITNKWFNSLFEKTDYNLINKQVADVKPGSGGVIFLPYLNGERTPHVNPNLSGMFMGINYNTGRAELNRAVMEGVAFALNQCIEVCGELGLHAESAVASGGGARSAPWLQIQADVFGIPLKVADTEEQAGLGSAIAAGVGAGIYKDIEEGCLAAVRYKDLLIVPDPENHKIYEEYYQLFKDTYTASKDVLQRVTLMGRRQ